MTGLLAVIAAVLASWPALRVLDIQEDLQRPRPEVFFDLTSRYNMLQLRLKNFGTSAAHDLELEWNDRPLNHEGTIVTSLDHVAVLLPQQSVSALIGSASSIVRQISTARYTGICRFRDASGKRHQTEFTCSVDGSLNQLIFDDELPRTFHELQKIPDQLERIAQLIDAHGRKPHE